VTDDHLVKSLDLPTLVVAVATMTIDACLAVSKRTTTARLAEHDHAVEMHPGLDRETDAEEIKAGHGQDRDLLLANAGTDRPPDHAAEIDQPPRMAVISIATCPTHPVVRLRLPRAERKSALALANARLDVGRKARLGVPLVVAEAGPGLATIRETAETRGSAMHQTRSTVMSRLQASEVISRTSRTSRTEIAHGQEAPHETAESARSHRLHAGRESEVLVVTDVTEAGAVIGGIAKGAEAGTGGTAMIVGTGVETAIGRGEEMICTQAPVHVRETDLVTVIVIEIVLALATEAKTGIEVETGAEAGVSDSRSQSYTYH
jgi:hypothetical protein